MISLGYWVANYVLRQTITEAKARRIGMWAAIIIGLPLVVLAVWGGIKMHDAGVVSQYQDKRDAAVENASNEADKVALANALERANMAEAEDNVIGAAMAEAKAKDPERGTREVGPVQQSYFDTLPKRRN